MESQSGISGRKRKIAALGPTLSGPSQKSRGASFHRFQLRCGGLNGCSGNDCGAQAHRREVGARLSRHAVQVRRRQALRGPRGKSRGTVLTLDNPGSTPSRRRRGWASPWERAARHAPTTAARLVLGWAAQHQEELTPAGRAPRADPQSLVPIPPLRSRVPGRDRPHPRVAFSSVGGRDRVAPGITCDTVDPWRG